MTERRILLVDDEADITYVLKKGLELRGFKVDSFTDPTEALSGFRPGLYGILISDLRMPGMTGVELLKEIRKIDDKIKILLMTALEIQEKELQTVAKQNELNAVIKKPVTINRLFDWLTRVMERPSENLRNSTTVFHYNSVDLVQSMQEEELIQPGGHNLLVYDDLSTLRDIFANYASAFLPKNEIIIFANQYDSIDILRRSLQEKGVNFAKYLAEGSLIILDAQTGYQGGDTHATFKLAMSLISRAKLEGRRGITWLGDMGSFLVLNRTRDLVDYELSCPTKYEDIMKTVCCYRDTDFNSLEMKQKDVLIQHHFKSLFVRK